MQNNPSKLAEAKKLIEQAEANLRFGICNDCNNKFDYRNYLNDLLSASSLISYERGREERQAEIKKSLSSIYECDDECKKGYKCFFEHHELMKKLDKALNHLTP